MTQVREMDRWTDQQQADLERQIKDLYQQATKDIKAKEQEFIDRLADKTSTKQKQVDDGRITQDEYNTWLKNELATASWWKSMRKSITDTCHQANVVANQYSKNNAYNVFAENANFASYKISQDAKMNLNFTLQDPDTVKRLIKEKPDLLPQTSVNAAKDKAWNQKVITEQVTQGILQGESIQKIARRFEDVAGMNHRAAVRDSRTAVTGAENAGRQDSYEEAVDMGIEMQKQWLATLDDRTRESHAEMDGETVDVDEPFSNGLMYPGDPNGDPAEVYNCRCTMISVLKDVPDTAMRRSREDGLIEDMTYSEWKDWKSDEYGDEEGYKTLYDDAEEYFDKNGYSTWRDSLTIGEKGAIKQYAGGGSMYEYENEYLREKISIEEAASRSKSTEENLNKRVLQKESAINKFVLNDPIRVLRTSSAEEYTRLKKGSVFVDKAFVSTTTNPERTVTGDNIIINVLVPSGKGYGAWVTPLSQNKYENEFLLQRSLRYKVVSISKHDGITHITMRVLKKRGE